MTTGDLKNNLRKFLSELKQVHFPQSELDIKGIAQGIPKAFLPVVHHVFLDYSISLAQYFATKEYDLYGKTDLRFMEAVYKVLRDEFGYKPQVTKEQFLSIGFVERKIISLCTILKLLREKNDELNPKSGKSERKKGKSSLQLNSKGAIQKETSSVTSSFEYFPGPLPVDTDMKRFQSNKEATEAGLGLTEPLVTRMIPYDDDANTEESTNPCSQTTGEDYSHENTGQRKSVKSTSGNSVPSNLVVKSVGDESHLGVKFPVSRNLEIRSNLCRQFQLTTMTHQEPNDFRQSKLKSVTWEDQVKESQTRQTKSTEVVPLEVPLSGGPNPLKLVPARVHSIPYSDTLPLSYPMQLDTTVSMATRPQAIPSPISMTTAPTPSPDLLLTPVIKSSQQTAISNSCCQKESDLQLYNDGLPLTKVVWLSGSSETISSGGSGHSPSNVKDVTHVAVLKQQVKELQDKFDVMTLLNNEMSARVVLLESRMKLLEEACEEKPCCACKNHPSTNKEITLQKDNATVVAGFDLHCDKDSASKFPIHPSKNGKIYNHTGNDKSILKHNTTSRQLFTEMATLTGGGDRGNKESFHENTPASISDKSDHEDDDDDEDKENNINAEETPNKSKTVSTSEQGDNIIILSPLSSPSRLSHVFADSATKNTVVNVHKRLQETRELLARTNKDFAAKFNHYQLE